MDRQLSVWAAPGLVLLVALIAAFAGHVPRGLVPTPGARPQPRPPAQPEVAVADEADEADEDAPSEPAQESAEPSAPDPDPEPEPADEPDAAPPTPSAPPVDGPAGVVAGRITWDGKAPEPMGLLNVPADQESTCCGAEMDRGERTLRVGADGGVADVVVVIEADGAEAAGEGIEVEMDQHCCRFEPHVLFVPEGASVRYKNSDQTNHNVKTDSKKNKSVNNSVAPGSSMVTALPKAEPFSVGCDIHPWMKAKVYVSEYSTGAVTAGDGTFRIEDVPPGTWKVELWSESAKAAESYEVTVRPGEVTEVAWKVGEGGKSGRRPR